MLNFFTLNQVLWHKHQETRTAEVQHLLVVGVLDGNEKIGGKKQHLRELDTTIQEKL